MSKHDEVKQALDNLIKKSRVHLYKPIQVAEILRFLRLNHHVDALDLELYRNQSKRWRDDVSRRLVGRVSTSSSKYQDVFLAKMPYHLT